MKVVASWTIALSGSAMPVTKCALLIELVVLLMVTTSSTNHLSVGPNPYQIEGSFSTTPLADDRYQAEDVRSECED